MEEGNAADGLGCGRRADLVPQRAGASRRTGPSTCTRIGNAPGSPTWPTTSWADRVPSRELDEILALVPDDFADPGADYRAVRAMMAPFHGHPLPGHVGVTEVELGGVRCAWYEDGAAPPRPRRLPLPRRRPRVVPARRLPLLRGHAGGAARSPRGHAGLPARTRARLSRCAPGLSAAYQGLLRSGIEPGRVVVSGDSCGGLLGLGALLDARDRRLPSAACFLSISGWFDVSVPDPVEGRDPFLSAGVGPEPGPGVRGGAGGVGGPPPLARLRRPGRPAPAPPAGRAVRHAPQGNRGTGARPPWMRGWT